MRKRSTYRPRHQLQDPLAWVINGFKPLTISAGNEVLLLRIKNHAALTAACEGLATFNDIDILVSAMNIAEALEKLGVSVGWANEIREGHDALYNACKRDKFLFTGTEVEAMSTAMEILDAQIEKCTIGQLDEAVRIVKEIIRLKKARTMSAKQLEPT